MKTGKLEIINSLHAGMWPGVKVCFSADMAGESIPAARVTRAGSNLPGGFRAEQVSAEEVERRRAAGGTEKRGSIATGCVPVQESLTLWLRAPFASIAKARKVFPSLLDVQLPFPLEKCVYQFLDMKRMPDRTIRALAVAARRDRVEEILRRYQSAGIDPELLDHEGLALWTQSIRELPSQACPARVVLFLSNDRITIAIGSEGQFRSAHSMSRDDRDESPDSIAERIRRYVQPELETGKPIEWVFCGPVAGNDNLARALHDKLATEWPGPMAVHGDPASFLLRALGARSLSQGPLRCNLRRGSLTHPNIARMSRRLAVSGAATLLAAGLFLCALSAAWHVMSARRFEHAKRAVAELAARIAPGERIPYGMEVSEVRKALDRQTELDSPFLDALSPSLVPRLADIVKAGNECKLGFESLALRKRSLLIAGTAEDWDHCEVFAQKIRMMGYSVALDRKEAVAEGPVRFELKGNTTTP